MPKTKRFSTEQVVFSIISTLILAAATIQIFFRIISL